MTSLASSFVIGSESSAQSFRDVIASYRRAQYLVAESTVVSDAVDLDDDNEETAVQDGAYDVEANQEWVQSDGSQWPQDDFVIGQLELDEDALDNGPQLPSTIASRPQRPPFSRAEPHQPKPRETTPLIRKISFSASPHLRRASLPQVEANKTNIPSTSRPVGGVALRRRSSAASTKSIAYHYGGRSTFGQTLFNSIAILLGIGLLSEPLAFSYAGWCAGTILIASYGFISCYTAKILAKIILADPRLRSYSDIGRKAFGPRSTIFISLMFCLELFAVSVVLVTLYADSLHSIIPKYPANTYKMWGVFLLIPTVFLPLSLLSYTSILGILSTLFLVIVVLIDGVSKKEAPGSFWEPAPTSFGIGNYRQLGIAFGLFMAGFAGHAVIPSLARDMIDPTQFDRMINWAFVIATFVYTLIGWAGYLMFGSNVSDEVSMDLLSTPGYDQRLNQAVLWMLVISPLSKFALTTQPLNATIEIVLGIDAVEDARNKSESNKPRMAITMPKRCVWVLQRIVLTGSAVAISISVPEFSALMSFLGSFSAFMLCVIGPISAKMIIEKKCGVFDCTVILLAVCMAIWGTSSAFNTPKR